MMGTFELGGGYIMLSNRWICTCICIFGSVLLLTWYLQDTEHNEKVDVPMYHKRFERNMTLPPCGEVCSYTGKVVRERKLVYPQLQKHIECDNIMKRMAYRGHPVVYPPPKYPPRRLLKLFTMQGDMPIQKIAYYKPKSNDTTKISHFTQSSISGLIDKVINGNKVNPYNDGMCVEHTIKQYVDTIKGNRGVVIGTITPWLEAILLTYGASALTTLEYSKLSFEDKRMDVYTPYTYGERYLSNNTQQFDFGATFSSLEHSGLGRYTDPLNPYGDLEAMAQAWCMIKPGGLFAVGIPVSADDKSFIVWNAHRVYGSKRLQHLTANWEVLGIVPCLDFHKLIVLRKPIK